MSPKNLGFNRSGIPPHASTHLVNLKLDKASDALKKYLNGERKTKPTQKMLEVLEENNVISKSGAGYSKVGGGYSKVGGKVNRLKKGNQWADFSKKQVKDGIDLGRYGYDACYDKSNYWRCC